MDKLTQLHREAAAKLELEILCGCAACGARLLEDGKPRPGSTIASMVGVTGQFPVCGKCVSNPTVMQALFSPVQTA